MTIIFYVDGEEKSNAGDYSDYYSGLSDYYTIFDPGKQTDYHCGMK